MGWPEETIDYRTFFPTDFLTTDPDIIFRWEARMIFSSVYFTGRIPFSDVYIHSTVLDRNGARMSRSKGVGVDPLEIIDKYGTDACRFTIAYLESQSQSYRLWNERFELGRNFANKVWNACRLVAPFFTVAGFEFPDTESLNPIDNWIIKRFNQTRERVDKGIDSYNFSLAAQALYEFFWHDLCDWYLELAKPRLKTNEVTVRAVLYHLVKSTLKLLHPIMPFITEELWHRLEFGAGSILDSIWPGTLPSAETGVKDVERMLALIVGIRQVRAEMRVPAKEEVECVVNTTDERFAQFLKEQEGLISGLARLSALRFGSQRPAESSLIVFSDCEAYIPLSGIVDVKRELERLRKEAEELKGLIAEIDRRLANPDFLARAKADVIERQQGRRQEFAARLDRLTRQLEAEQQ
jgi:valyl-tRNA synthetase